MIGKTFYSFYTFFPVKYVILISSQNFEQLCTCMHYKDNHSESNGFWNLEKQRINIQWVYSNPAATIRKQVSIALLCDKRFNQNIGQKRDEFISLSCLLIHWHVWYTNIFTDTLINYHWHCNHCHHLRY